MGSKVGKMVNQVKERERKTGKSDNVAQPSGRMVEDLKLQSKSTEAPKTQQQPQQPGEGIRSMKTSSAFRALNFELYVKPNKYVMIIGGISAVGAFGYLAYMKMNWDRKKYYLAEKEDGQLIITEKRSRWDS